MFGVNDEDFTSVTSAVYGRSDDNTQHGIKKMVSQLTTQEKNLLSHSVMALDDFECVPRVIFRKPQIFFCDPSTREGWSTHLTI